MAANPARREPIRPDSTELISDPSLTPIKLQCAITAKIYDHSDFKYSTRRRIPAAAAALARAQVQVYVDTYPHDGVRAQVHIYVHTYGGGRARVYVHIYVDRYGRDD